MKKIIITIGREFGSGGREFGQRLAEAMQIAYYDREIITEIAKRTSMAERYIRQIVERRPIHPFPLTIGQTFCLSAHPVQEQALSIYRAQSRILEEMARKSDCVIVGRCADYILQDRNPFRIFIYADMKSKLERCRNRANPKEKQLSDKDLTRQIQSVDRHRADYYEFYTGQSWGNRLNYDLCLNTSRIPMDEIVLAVAGLFP